MTGWICPVCGAGVAPNVSRCDHGGEDQPGAPFFSSGPVSPTAGGTTVTIMHTGSVQPSQVENAIAVQLRGSAKLACTAGNVRGLLVGTPYGNA